VNTASIGRNTTPAGDWLRTHMAGARRYTL
jgi:hypothetical protein